MLKYFSNFCSENYAMHWPIVCSLWVQFLANIPFLEWMLYLTCLFTFSLSDVRFTWQSRLEQYLLNLNPIQFNTFVFVIRASLQKMHTLFNVKMSILCGMFKTWKRPIGNSNHEILIKSLDVIYFDFKNIYTFVWYYLRDWSNWIIHEFLICFIACVDDWTDSASLWRKFLNFIGISISSRSNAFFLFLVMSIAWFEIILLSNLHRFMHPFESQCSSFVNNRWDMIFISYQSPTWFNSRSRRMYLHDWRNMVSPETFSRLSVRNAIIIYSF
jgi:hypothetical protein